MSVREAAKKWVKDRIKGVILGFALPTFYRVCARKPLKPGRALFVEASSPVLSNSLQAMFDKVDSDYGYEARFVSLAQRRTNMLGFGLNCAYMAWLAARAAHIFYCEGNKPVGCLPLRPETTTVQLWHGCGAVKKFGMSTAEKTFGGDRREQLRHPLYANADLVTVSSPEVTWAYEEAMNLKADSLIVQPTGVSRTDMLLDPAFPQWAHDQVARMAPIDQGKRVILYAPTFRGRVATATAPDQLDIRQMADELRSTHVLLIKHHPHVEKLPPIPAGCEGFAFDLTREAPIETLMAVCDVCVSDYSSLVFECALLGKPMAFFAYDLDDYDDWRGFYYDYDELTPGPVVKTTAEIIDFARQCAVEPDTWAADVDAFRQRFMSSCDGNCTARIADIALTGEIPSRSRDTESNTACSSPAETIDVSIVMPTYNSMPYVREALDSVVAQTHPADQMQLLAVDDCSTDGTWECIQEYAELYPDLVVPLRLDRNSGSGAAPRNRGLDEAEGEFVFFLDSDDWLAPRAIERMVRHAREWGSDVLLVKMASEGGRSVPTKQFRGNNPSVDLTSSGVLETFGPIKLFRRSMLEKEGIRFPTGFMPEDISFVLRAYVAAGRISVASDYDYYHCRLHDTGTQSTFSTWDDIDSNLAAMRDVLGVAEKLPAEARSKSLVPRLLRRDVHRMLRSLGGKPLDVQARQIVQIRELFRPHYDEEARCGLPAEARIACDAALLHDEATALAALPHIASRHLIDECDYLTDGGRLRYSLKLPEAEGAVTGDLTESTKFTCRLERIDYDRNGFTAHGTLKAGVVWAALLDDTAFSLVAKEDDGREATWAGTCEWSDAPDGEGERAATATWSVRLDYQDFDAFADSLPRPGKRYKGICWHLFLRLAYRGYIRDGRLASSAAPLARMAFAECGGQRDGYALDPMSSSYGKMDLKQRKSR